MKTMILTLSLMIGAAASAKVADFNSIIGENVRAQRQLYKEVKAQSEETREALAETPGEKTQVVVETPGDAIHVPTSKQFMKFRKETVNHQAKEKEMEKRLANEFKSVDREF